MKYTHILPRRSAFAGVTTSTAASNYSYLALFNNTSYAEYLVVKDASFSAAPACVVNFFTQQANLAGTSVPIFPWLPSDAPPPGLVTTGQNTTQPLNGYQVRLGGNQGWQWVHDWPICILPPGFSFVIQNNAVNTGFITALAWQAIKPEQLDEGSWLQANAALLPQSG